MDVDKDLEDEELVDFKDDPMQIDPSAATDPSTIDKPTPIGGDEVMEDASEAVVGEGDAEMEDEKEGTVDEVMDQDETLTSAHHPASTTIPPFGFAPPSSVPSHLHVPDSEMDIPSANMSPVLVPLSETTVPAAHDSGSKPPDVPTPSLNLPPSVDTVIAEQPTAIPALSVPASASEPTIPTTSTAWPPDPTSVPPVPSSLPTALSVPDSLKHEEGKIHDRLEKGSLGDLASVRAEPAISPAVSVIADDGKEDETKDAVKGDGGSAAVEEDGKVENGQIVTEEVISEEPAISEGIAPLQDEEHHTEGEYTYEREGSNPAQDPYSEQHPDDQQQEYQDDAQQTEEQEQDEIDSDETIDGIPSIILVLSQTNQRTLFNHLPDEYLSEIPFPTINPTDDDQAPEEESYEQLDEDSIENIKENLQKMPLLPEMADELVNAPLSRLFDALRVALGIALGDEWDEDRGTELVLSARALGLRIGEDNKHSDSITLHDLIDLHRRCNCPEPMMIHLEHDAVRFIAKYNAIKRILDEAEGKDQQDDDEEDEIETGYEEDEEGEEGEEAVEYEEGEVALEQGEYVHEDEGYEEEGAMGGEEHDAADAPVNENTESVANPSEDVYDSVEHTDEYEQGEHPHEYGETGQNPETEGTGEGDVDGDEYGIDAAIRAAEDASHADGIEGNTETAETADESAPVQPETEEDELVDYDATVQTSQPQPDNHQQDHSAPVPAISDSTSSITLISPPHQEASPASSGIKRPLETDVDQLGEDGRVVKRKLSDGSAIAEGA